MKITSELFQKAIEFAVKAHSKQTRKGDGRPYIVHPFAVMLTLAEVKKSKNAFLLAIVCLLHDVVEDCGITIEEIAKEFGYQIASLVDELTTNKEECRRLGKTEYLAQKMFNMSSYALVIKLCDRLNNLSDMETLTDEFKKKTIDSTKIILERISKRKLSPTHKKLIKLIEKKLK